MDASQANFITQEGCDRPKGQKFIECDTETSDDTTEEAKKIWKILTFSYIRYKFFLYTNCIGEFEHFKDIFPLFWFKNKV